MTVSIGNGVDIGNLVTAQTDPLTGGIAFYGPDGGITSAKIKQNTQVLVGASTVEETLFERTIPAGWMRENSEMVIEWLIGYNNSVGTKTFRIYLGVQQILAVSYTTTTSARGRTRISNRNALNIQVAGSDVALTGFMEGSSVSPIVTFAVDFSAPVVLKVTGRKSNSADVMGLEQLGVSIS